MAKVFLDVNFFFDLIEQRREIPPQDIQGHEFWISPLSLHILMYVYKHQVPDQVLEHQLRFFSIANFDGYVSKNSLQGPTKDFEDNVQLHSAAAAECDFFLTLDKELLKLTFFGKLKILNDLHQLAPKSAL